MRRMRRREKGEQKFDFLLDYVVLNSNLRTSTLQSAPINPLWFPWVEESRDYSKSLDPRFLRQFKSLILNPRKLILSSIQNCPFPSSLSHVLSL